jgi:hypothetical protein
MFAIAWYIEGTAGLNTKCIGVTYENFGRSMLCSDRESVFSGMLTSRACKVGSVQRSLKLRMRQMIVCDNYVLQYAMGGIRIEDDQIFRVLKREFEVMRKTTSGQGN